EQERMVQVWSGSQVARDADGGTALTCGQAAGVSPADQVRWCVMGEGATWIGTPVNARVPAAVPMVDADPGREHGPHGGGLPWGEAAVPARAWGEARRARLCWGDGDGAMAGWDTLQRRKDQTA